VLYDHGVEQMPHGLLTGLGKPGDGIELLLDPGCWTALTRRPNGGLSDEQLIE
jgi:hypothetical protein